MLTTVESWAKHDASENANKQEKENIKTEKII